MNPTPVGGYLHGVFGRKDRGHVADKNGAGKQLKTKAAKPRLSNTGQHGEENEETVRNAPTPVKTAARSLALTSGLRYIAAKTMRQHATSLVIAGGAAFVLAVAPGCGSSNDKEARSDGGSSGAVSNKKDAGLAGGPSSEGGTTSDAGLQTGTVIVGQLDGAATSLPALPELTNVVATQREDSVGIDFDPVDDAVDYRVYPLPADGSFTQNADGSLTIPNAIYRCAGLRQTYDVANNLDSSGIPTPQSDDGSGVFVYDGNGYSWQTQLTQTPTIGYVYVSPGPNLVPVYALAGYTLEFEVAWNESRLKYYTTDSNERQTLISQGWRDDGIVFYVPSSSGANTVPVYHSEDVQPGTNIQYQEYYYFLAADMAMHTGDTTPPVVAFQVLSSQADGTQPLMASYYNPGQNHTELSVGNERYKRAANQGPGPLWHLEWAGLTQPTTLVVEALASGCPFQGLLSPNHFEEAPHQTFYTLADLQAASSTGEVYINGQYDGPSSPAIGLGAPGENNAPGPALEPSPLLATSTMSPKPIARSFVQVAPQPHNPSDWDFYEGFTVGTDIGTSTPEDGGALCGPGHFGPVCGNWQTPEWDIAGYALDGATQSVLTYGYFLGQLWTVFDDASGDTTGKIRFTNRQLANISSDPNQYLHATMSVNMVSTNRRYPQLIVSDQMAPVQEGLGNPDNNTILFQSIQQATRFEMQAIHGLVNGKGWDVNNQAPEHEFARVDYSALPAVVISNDIAPIEHIGVDRMTRFDVYVSSQQVYFFADGIPLGCSQYPSGFSLSGPVTVTIGDVIYHEGAPDEHICTTIQPFPFLHEHQCTETVRHFDDVAFKSGVPAPAWDSSVHPCEAY